ncbi:hypothetical protein LXL04_035246 [Taraxacum kok-saghyz]
MSYTLVNLLHSFEPNPSNIPFPSNPNTIVKWFHCPNSSSDVVTFKYVFWAFGPAIDAVCLCRPVISVNACHLKGSYKGKILVAVTKDANNSILPFAYAIVDEETSHSWGWFFYNLRNFVVQDRQLCVISDRHKGIINAMENLQDWKVPFAYHRFCLRHVRSNFMQKFKNVSLKKLCWSIGSTTQERKYVTYMKEIKNFDIEAWKYLKKIRRSQWCFLFDENRRWGMLTTNIAESMNNALRGARQLPIRACIDLIFNRTVHLFRKHSDVAMNCNTPLPSCIWRLFRKRETHAQSHILSDFDYNEVCSYRGDNPLSIVNTVYTTMTYRQQYTSSFVPLSLVDYWLESDWKIKVDDLKLSVHRGRKRSNRFHNDMDIRHPGEPRKCGLCHQPECQQPCNESTQAGKRGKLKKEVGTDGKKLDENSRMLSVAPVYATSLEGETHSQPQLDLAQLILLLLMVTLLLPHPPLKRKPRRKLNLKLNMIKNSERKS